MEHMGLRRLDPFGHPPQSPSKGHPQEPNANSVAWNTEMEDGAEAQFVRRDALRSMSCMEYE